MKKKLIALGLALALVGVSVVSGTLAYLTDTDKATNVFTVGNIDIELDEDTGVYDIAGNLLADRYVTYENGTAFNRLVPTNKIEKKVTISNTGKNDAYVRAVVIVNNALEIWQYIDEVYLYDGKTGGTVNGVVYDNDNDYIEAVYDYVFDGWNLTWVPRDAAGNQNDACYTVESSEFINVDTTRRIDDYFEFGLGNIFGNDMVEHYTGAPVYHASNISTGYYAKILNKYELCLVYYSELDVGKSVTLFNGLNVPADFNGEQLKMFENLKVEIYADAIQAEGFNYPELSQSEIDAGYSTLTDKLEAIRAFKELENAHPLNTLRAVEPIEVVLGTKLPNSKTKTLTDAEIDTVFNGIEDVACAMTFNAVEDWEELETLINNPDTYDYSKMPDYYQYNADFVLKFDQSFNNSQKEIKLLGNYGNYGNVPLDLPDFIEAGKEYRIIEILDEQYFNGLSPMPYPVVLGLVGDGGFSCGLIIEDSVAADLDFQLDLRLYETKAVDPNATLKDYANDLLNVNGYRYDLLALDYPETGKYFVISSDKFTY